MASQPTLPLTDPFCHQYPDYLAEKSSILSPEDLSRYTDQRTCVSQIVAIFEKPSYSDDNAVQSSEVLRLMNEVPDSLSFITPDTCFHLYLICVTAQSLDAVIRLPAVGNHGPHAPWLRSRCRRSTQGPRRLCHYIARQGVEAQALGLGSAVLARDQCV